MPPGDRLSASPARARSDDRQRPGPERARQPLGRAAKLAASRACPIRGDERERDEASRALSANSLRTASRIPRIHGEPVQRVGGIRDDQASRQHAARPPE